jgi:hypothetical protein
MSTVTKYGMPVKAQLKALQNTPMLREYGFIPYPQDRGHLCGDYKGENFQFHRYKNWVERYYNDELPEAMDSDIYYIKPYFRNNWQCFIRQDYTSWNDDVIAVRFDDGLYFVVSDKIGKTEVEHYIVFEHDSFNIRVEKVIGLYDDLTPMVSIQRGFTRAIDALRYIRGNE